MTSNLQWSCSSCTYLHSAPGNRCVMCGNLRNASTQEMVAFIEGRSALSRTSSRDEEEDAVPKIPAQPRPSAKLPTQPQPTRQPEQQQKKQQPKAMQNNSRLRNPYASGTASGKVNNPYASKSKGAHISQNATSTAAPVTAPTAAPAAAASKIPIASTDQWPAQQDTNNSNVAIENQPPNRQAFFQQQSEKSSRSLPSVQQQQKKQQNGLQVIQPAAAAAKIRPSTAQPMLRPSTNNNTTPVQQRPSSSNSSKQNKNVDAVVAAAAATAEKNKKLNPFVRAAHRAHVYQSGPVPLDAELSKNWIYPVHPNFPVRNYQLEISQTAIQYNTLVSLPTGLGKTLIAAVVLYNYYRWFPVGGKVVFLAPTLPLVDQQVRACYQIMGIPAQDTAVLNGKVPAATRVQLWKERRVFFCTPQTVEKDMEAKRCPAKQIVCLVLDEAHKATGNFSYTKVVELCEAAGSHLRILGLSATPGAKVQQVQKVIDALRITRLEARSEEEVKEYIHERHNEIVVVKKRSLCHAIEQQLNALIAPVMQKLRSNTNIRQRIGPNDCTLTSFCIHRGRKHHHETTNDHSHDGYFIAAQKLIDARANLFSHGIGSVRGKLLELKNNPQRGVLSAIVKSEKFQEVFDAVITASSGKHSQETAEDKKGNNPKLAKLDEILQEHFLRAEASKSTTRAIVFSQWRESVSEIVDVLSLSRPLIRPRHFVGQSSGSKVGAMKGMPQKIQQEAIREFQEGIFNVLVCTCIGEEGLDIGEVDLIVNYDTLRSPIRMIQRVGRTGRKRDGRVVCLVSEGQEQKDMAKSKNNERSLQRALRRSDNFKLRPNRIMFPQPPALIKKDMIVTEKLQLSQVGGHAAPAARNKKDVEAVDSWKLTDQKESIRFQTFGHIKGIKCTTNTFPLLAKRKLLRARMKSYASISTSRRYAQKAVAGASRRLLMTVEAITDEKQESTRKFRSVNERDSAGIFPLEDSKCRDKSTIVEFNWDERLPLKAAPRQASETAPRISSPIEEASNVVPTNPRAALETRTKVVPAIPPKNNEVYNAVQGKPPEVQVIPASKEPPRLASLKEKASNMISANPSSKQVKVGKASSLLDESGPIVDRTVASIKPSFQGGVSAKRTGDFARELPQIAVFKLPTPPASSSESECEDSDEDEPEEETMPMPTIPKEIRTVVMKETVKLPTLPASSREGECSDEEAPQVETKPKEAIPKEVETAIMAVTIKLPTPPSSSSESDGEGSDDDDDVNETAKPTKTKNINGVVIAATLKLTTPPASSGESDNNDNNGSFDLGKRVTILKESTELIEAAAPPVAITVTRDRSTQPVERKGENDNENAKLHVRTPSIQRADTQAPSSSEIAPVDDFKNSLEESKRVQPRNKPTDFKTALEVLQSSVEKKDSQSVLKKPRLQDTAAVGKIQICGAQGFHLPTQDSSSEEDSACSDGEDNDDYNGSVHTKEGEHRRPTDLPNAVTCVNEKVTRRESFAEADHKQALGETTTAQSIDQNFVYTLESEGNLSHTPKSPLIPKELTMIKDDGEISSPRDKPRAKNDNDLLDTPSAQSNHKFTPELPSPKQLIGKLHSLIPQPKLNEESPHELGHNEFYLGDGSPEMLHRMSRPRSRHNVLMTQHTDDTPSVSRLSSKCDELTNTPSITGSQRASQAILVDTPVQVQYLGDLVDTPEVKHAREARFCETQDDVADDIVCIVCHCGDSHEELDPIVLCDGVMGNECSFAAHASCYSLEPAVINLLDEWRCDVCEQQKKEKLAGFKKPSCFVCQGSDGALKLSLDASRTWFHPYCMAWTDDDAVIICNLCSFPGATTCGFKTCSRAAHPHCVRELGDSKCWLTVVDNQRKQNLMFCPEHRNEEHTRLQWNHDDEESQLPLCFFLPSSRITMLKAQAKRELPSSKKYCERSKKAKLRTAFEDDADDSIVANSICSKDGKRQRLRQNLARRQRGMRGSAFLDAEAGINSDDDIGGDDEEASELRQIDEEEELAASGFINDSSQLGYSQDDLDRIEPEDAGEEPTSIHRLVDAENERNRRFATPIFNRRMRRGVDSQGSDAWTSSPNSANRSSEKGLGKCLFIRSVIAHDREGGNAEEIEAAFHEIAREVAEEEKQEEAHSPPAAPGGPLVIEYIPSSDEEDDGSVCEATNGCLTAAQKAVIEKKRLEALARLKKK